MLAGCLHDRALDIVSQAAGTLQAAHDSGVARPVDAAPLTTTGRVMGTAAHPSPEQGQRFIGATAMAPVADLACGRAPTTSAATVRIDAGDYQGEGCDEVLAALTQRCLRVRESPTGTGGRPGTVTEVSPVGSLPARTLVTVTVVPAPSGAPKTDPQKHKKKGY